jgi:hypothetical protein
LRDPRVQLFPAVLMAASITCAATHNNIPLGMPAKCLDYNIAMVVEIKAETERLVREEIQRGHFASVDDIIESGVRSRPLTSGPVKSRADAVAHIRAMQCRDLLPPSADLRQWIDEGRD